MSRKTFLRGIVASAILGATCVSVAWAGAVLAPASGTSREGSGQPSIPGLTGRSGTDAAAPSSLAPSNAVLDRVAALASRQPPGKGRMLAGAAKRSIAPRPIDYGGIWETDHDRCATLSAATVKQLGVDPTSEAHLADTGSPWPENPNCIYQGGFGIGPMNPVRAFDTEYGLWIRAIAIGDGADTIVLVIVDGEGWFWDYGTKCDDCGSKQIGQRLGTELGIDPSGIVIAATHSHAAPDFIGGWGFVPDWYMRQVTETIRATAHDAVAAMEPSVVEVGEVMARGFNGERRDTYRSAEEQQLGWLRAWVPARKGGGGRPPAPQRVIATLGAYAAHPTTKGTNDGVAHADWPGIFERSLEDRFGGIGFHFMTGLGNMSSRGDTGPGLAALVPDVGFGQPLGAGDLSVKRATWRQPATNVPLTALGLPGFFDHQFDPIPASVSVGKSENAPCASASPVSIEATATAIRVGDLLAITTGPGEEFSNLSNTIKEQAGAKVTMPLSQANDALGYMPQSFELNPVGQQGLGFAVGGYVFVNYEDSYAIDRCFGDMALETTLGLLAAH